MNCEDMRVLLRLIWHRIQNRFWLFLIEKLRTINLLNIFMTTSITIKTLSHCMIMYVTE